MKPYETPKQFVKQKWPTAHRRSLNLLQVASGAVEPSAAAAVSGYVWRWIERIIQK